MRVITHRGLWDRPQERNTARALCASFNMGWGTETDVRDLDGELVVSHDPPTRSATILTVATLLQIYVSSGARDLSLPLALNIKSDGIAELLRSQLVQMDVTSAFAFDMAVPDQRAYLSEPISVFTRHSDVETVPTFYAACEGVWLDSFGDDSWVDVDTVVQHLEADKMVCIVSPELHGRSPHALWERLAEGHRDGRLGDSVMLCTDTPNQAEAVMMEGAR